MVAGFGPLTVFFVFFDLPELSDGRKLLFMTIPSQSKEHNAKAKGTLLYVRPELWVGAKARMVQ
jgi:hypothetical protein